MRLGRRQVLFGALAAALATVLTRRTAARDSHDPILAVIDHVFPELRMTAEARRRFAEDLVTLFPGVARHPGYRRYSWLSWIRDLGAVGRMLPGGVADNVDGFEAMVVDHFLLSTDFLDVVEDPAASVEYIAIADPYTAGCANRLARFD